MPELPEVEVVRAGLAQNILPCQIKTVRVKDQRSLRRYRGSANSFIDYLTESRIVDICRRGKYLWLLLADQHQQLKDTALVMHLGMSGQLLLKKKDFPPEKHQKIFCDLTLTQGRSIQLRFIDQRIFGGMYLDPLLPVKDRQGQPCPGASKSQTNRALLPASLSHLGRDPLDPYFSLEEFCQKVLRSRSAIKRLLLDQSLLSGVGNIYADEALWQAKLHYGRPGKSLSKEQCQLLLTAVKTVMLKALQAGGTSFDALYVNVNGQSGYFDRSLQAYSQQGKPCSRCLSEGQTSLIQREPFMNRSSYRCPRCQVLDP
ncbi:MAG: bifunctional DNA-formamidopyrimidine glycosylase/DNA-(apurinic or apyrimidinic site) lyase [Rothia sp. (in: high G+C Gram-positive bacteria)]|nr:bifunctional DNA-formamidopyrimidine glycosylase/DNA-(apurinic or apyrimidinic site) lyase [Rothia sp. (in: high G+C Gram-positive bacteria)]